MSRRPSYFDRRLALLTRESIDATQERITRALSALGRIRATLDRPGEIAALLGDQERRK